MEDETDAELFIEAQDTVWANVLKELQDGEKRTHWMWFVFPQLAALGQTVGYIATLWSARPGRSPRLSGGPHVADPPCRGCGADPRPFRHDRPADFREGGCRKITFVHDAVFSSSGGTGCVPIGTGYVFRWPTLPPNRQTSQRVTRRIGSGAFSQLAQPVYRSQFRSPARDNA